MSKSDLALRHGSLPELSLVSLHSPLDGQLRSRALVTQGSRPKSVESTPPTDRRARSSRARSSPNSATKAAALLGGVHEGDLESRAGTKSRYSGGSAVVGSVRATFSKLRVPANLDACMSSACVMVEHMSKMIQIRNVPDDVHREAKARAARAGMSLSDYLLREVKRSVEAPTIEELLERMAARERPQLTESPVQAVRAERSAR